MQYLLSVWGNENDVPPGPEAMEKMYKDVDAVNNDIKASGAWVFAGGLFPTSSATVVNATSGDTITTDGPFAETKEFLGGFWVIDVEDLDSALDWAAKGSAACGGPVEVRPFQDEPS